MSEIKIDAATGLPGLPDGQFWRVAVNDGDWEIQLRQRHWFWSSIVQRREIAFARDVTAERIRAKADEIMSSRADQLRRMNLLGDYPPKKLGEPS